MTEQRANFKIETHAKYLSFQSGKSFKGKIVARAIYLKPPHHFDLGARAF